MVTPRRFPPDVEARLRTADWFPGRDSGAYGREWLAVLEEKMRDQGFPVYIPEPLRAAVREFGGLDFDNKGRGITLGRFDFSIAPGSASFHLPGVIDVSDLVGELTLVFGSTVDGPSELLMGASGKVYLNNFISGYFHLGETLDEALVNLLRGIRTEEVDSSYPDCPPAALPVIVGSMVMDGQVYRETGCKHAEPNLHPALRTFFDGLPPAQREPGTGRCAEAVLVSDRLWESQTHWDDLDIAPAWVREYFEYNKTAVTTYRVRESGDPTRNTYQPPCRSCAAMLNHFGIEADDVDC